MKIHSALLLAIITYCNVLSAQNGAAQFVDGDRVCFVGNSITNMGYYHQLIGLFYQTRYPLKYFRFYNCGTGGDRAGEIYRRLEADVFSKKPTHITCMTGMNDAYGNHYTLEDEEEKAKVDKYLLEINRNYMDSIALKINAYNPNSMTLILSSIYDQTVQLENPPDFGRNDLIRKIGDNNAELAIENNYGFVDFNTPLLIINAKQQKQDPAFSIIGPDRGHPGWMGSTVMAYTFLKSQGVIGRVAKIGIDINTMEVIESENCTVTMVKGVDKVLSFNYIPRSLPFPNIDIEDRKGTFDDALKLVPFTQDFNQEIIQVTGLQGKYILIMDGEELGRFEAFELGDGVNISLNCNNSQQKQAQQILTLSHKIQQLESILRQKALIEFRVLISHGLESESPIEIQKPIIDAWFEKNPGYKGAVEGYYKNIDRKKEDVWNEVESVYVKIDQLNDPLQHQFELKQQPIICTELKTGEIQSAINKVNPEIDVIYLSSEY